MSSRKHYIDVAATLLDARAQVTVPDALDAAIEGIALNFKRDNPRFNRQKFLDAAGYGREDPTPVDDLQHALDEAEDLADGEAVDAYNVLSDAVHKFLQTPEYRAATSNR